MCEKYETIKTWRNLLYIVIIGDLAYIKTQYDSMMKSAPRRPTKSKPTIETVDDASKPNMSTTPQEGKSIESIPVYTPTKVECKNGYCPVNEPIKPVPQEQQMPQVPVEEQVELEPEPEPEQKDEEENIPTYEPENDK